MLHIQDKNKYIIGVDECGYGAWAGPIVIGAVRAPADWSFPGLNDSKKLNAESREKISNELAKLVKEKAIQISMSMSPNWEIDELGLGNCHKMCFVTAINNLYSPEDTVILDGNLNPKHLLKHGLIQPCNIRSEVKGDAKFSAIMAASIVAKNFRDSMMATVFHGFYPQYHWNHNAGYIVPEHKAAVVKYGLSTFHRKSYNVKL